jgi:APA family basic amino acid/polyamine antiporter
MLVYLAVALSALAAIGAAGVATASAPLAAAVEAGRWSFAASLVRFGAAAASLGVLLSLIAGISRTVFAMASAGDLPGWLAVVHPTHRVPHRAEVIVGSVVAAIASIADLRYAIGFSSFTVLVYYAVTNASALRLSRAERQWPRHLAVLGLIGCAALAVNLPLRSSVSGTLVLLVGLVIFVGHRSFRKLGTTRDGASL